MDFGNKARLHQASFKVESETFTEGARVSGDDRGQRNGHLLALGHEIENIYPAARGRAMDFFSSRSIHWWQSVRSGDVTKSPHPTRNMASSQVACVNFLMPLADSPGALAGILRSVDRDASSVSSVEYTAPSGQAIKSNVEFEWIGLERPLEPGSAYTRGANVTSVDAIMVGNYPGGKRAYLFEWKYVESYSERDYKGAGEQGKTRRNRYRDMFSSPDSPFTPEAQMDHFLYEPFYQIMRLLLLGKRMVLEKEFGVNDFRVVVVVPRLNVKYRETITSKPLRKNFRFNTVEEAVKYFLKNPNVFRIVSQNELLNNISGVADKEWVYYIAGRYIDA